jgi:hypothetical protein
MKIKLISKIPCFSEKIIFDSHLPFQTLFQTSETSNHKYIYIQNELNPNYIELKLNQNNILSRFQFISSIFTKSFNNDYVFPMQAPLSQIPIFSFDESNIDVNNINRIISTYFVNKYDNAIEIVFDSKSDDQCSIFGCANFIFYSDKGANLVKIVIFSKEYEINKYELIEENN